MEFGFELLSRHPDAAYRYTQEHYEVLVHYIDTGFSADIVSNVLADPKRRANVVRERREAIAEILAYTLAELRKAREVTQVEIAGLLSRGQSTVSALEHSEDPKLSTLREYIEALGGRLEVTAVFEDERFDLKV